MSKIITEKVFRRYAQLSDDQKDTVVNRVIDNLKSKKTDESQDMTEDKVNQEDNAEVETSEDTDISDESEDTTDLSEYDLGPYDEESEEVTDETEDVDSEESIGYDDSEDESDELGSMVDSLRKEIDNIKSDGKVERSEFLGMFKQMMEMVIHLVDAKPPQKKRASIEERLAARGQQVMRKDKDTMSDTGGVSKGRRREPNERPPRDDVKNRYKPKRQNEKLDIDTDDDKDLKKEASVHPLDRKAEFNFGIVGPENNYYREVWSSLVKILADKNAISEKSFSARDELHNKVNKLLRIPKVMAIVNHSEERNLRPSFCAEQLYSILVQNWCKSEQRHSQ